MLSPLFCKIRKLRLIFTGLLQECNYIIYIKTVPDRAGIDTAGIQMFSSSLRTDLLFDINLKIPQLSVTT